MTCQSRRVARSGSAPEISLPQQWTPDGQGRPGQSRSTTTREGREPLEVSVIHYAKDRERQAFPRSRRRTNGVDPR